MKNTPYLVSALLKCLLFLTLAPNAHATTYFVTTNGNDSSAGTSWSTARQTIQAAIDLTVPNDTVLVSNGVYATGGRVVYGAMPNRITITNGITVQSVGGPSVTVIEGFASGIDAAVVRCAYVGANAVLSGFTLTKGGTQVFGDPSFDRRGGGAYCEEGGVVTNCILTGNSASSGGGGAYGGTLNDCMLTNNSVWWDGGGGAYGSTLNNCTLSGNVVNSGSGGGAYMGTLNNCTLTNNSAGYGGGAFGGLLSHCTLIGNSAQDGGGAYNALLSHCTLAGNSAKYGGGSHGGILSNCLLSANSAVGDYSYGGGSYFGTLDNCTLSDNSSEYAAGGAYYGTLNNCTLSSNHAGALYGYGGGAHSGTLSNCTLSGNSAASEGGGAYMASLNNCTLSGNSSALFAGGTMGGTLNNCIVYSNLAQIGPNYYNGTISYCCTTPLPSQGTGNITNAPLFVAAADLHLAAGSPCINAGNNAYAMELTTDLDGNPRIIGGTVDMGAYEYSPPVHYVALTSANPEPPFLSWATAATNIQDAIDVAAPAETVLVSNGVYAVGGRAVFGSMTNRVAIMSGITVRSVGGPAVTVIQGAPDPVSTNGDAAVRCVYVGTNALLSGFTLSHGATRAFGNGTREQSGGGAWCEASAWVTNCILTGNFAQRDGGGAYGGTFSHCTLAGNSAWRAGGGVRESTLHHCLVIGNSGGEFGGGSFLGTLNNCTLSRNSALVGGGAMGGTVNNSIVYFNEAGDGADLDSVASLNYSCSTSDAGGSGNILAAPQFVNAASGNYRLQSGSPCVNAGTNWYVNSTTDIDGHPRIIDGTVDMGAYEFGATANGIAWGWLAEHGLSMDGAGDLLDPDGDGANTRDEYIADTQPTNAASRFAIVQIEKSSTTRLWFVSSSNRVYTLETSANLLPGSWVNVQGQTRVPSSGGMASLRDTNAPPNAFYRVGVALP